MEEECERAHQRETQIKAERLQKHRLFIDKQMDVYIQHIPNIVGRYPRRRRVIYLRVLDQPFQDEWDVCDCEDYPLWDSFQHHRRWFVTLFLEKLKLAGYVAKYRAGYFWIQNPLCDRRKNRK